MKFQVQPVPDQVTVVIEGSIGKPERIECIRLTAVEAGKKEIERQEARLK